MDQDMIREGDGQRNNNHNAAFPTIQELYTRVLVTRVSECQEGGQGRPQGRRTDNTCIKEGILVALETLIVVLEAPCQAKGCPEEWEQRVKQN